VALQRLASGFRTAVYPIYPIFIYSLCTIRGTDTYDILGPLRPSIGTMCTQTENIEFRVDRVDSLDNAIISITCAVYTSGFRVVGA
jgi:hypothetical protein